MVKEVVGDLEQISYKIRGSGLIATTTIKYSRRSKNQHDDFRPLIGEEFQEEEDRRLT